MNCQWSVVKTKETCDTDGLDASYPQGTFAVQYTETLKLRQWKVCIIFMFIKVPWRALGDSLLTSVKTEQIMYRIKKDQKNTLTRQTDFVVLTVRKLFFEHMIWNKNDILLILFYNNINIKVFLNILIDLIN